VLPHQYGLSTQTLAGWTLDRVKQAAIGGVVGSLLVALLYWSIRRSPRRWWLGFWLASIPLAIAGVLLVPLVIEPLFNKFRPLQNEALRTRILALAHQAGIEEGRVFEVDASQRTKAVNAYVTGLGGSARIVLWDTLLQRLDEDEALFVMSHEIGHYAERHVPIGLTLGIFGTLGVLLLTDGAARRLIKERGDQWDVRGLDDLASLPVLLVIVSLISFFGSPVESAISRTMETRADQFALRQTGNPEAGVASFIKLAELNLSHPSPPPFIELWMFSHPPLQKRIDAARAWEKGAGGK
jgi:Zn-dependent protease with chaperone function